MAKEISENISAFLFSKITVLTLDVLDSLAIN